MKSCIIIHGGPLSDTEEKIHTLHQLHWQPWVKKELEMRGIPCSVPAMPKPWFPEYKQWKLEFELYSLNESTILVGHSRGAAFLVRWLSETKRSVAKLILIAPNLKTQSIHSTIKNFYSFDIDIGIQHRVNERIVFTSENDDLENIKSAQLLATELDCKVINLPSYGHYITQDMGSDEFQELVDCILK